MRNSENRVLKKKKPAPEMPKIIPQLIDIVNILICYNRYTLTNTWRGADVKQKIKDHFFLKYYKAKIVLHVLLCKHSEIKLLNP